MCGADFAIAKDIWQTQKSKVRRSDIAGSVFLWVAYGDTCFYLLYTAAERPPADINLFQRKLYPFDKGSTPPAMVFSMNQRRSEWDFQKRHREAPDAISTSVYCVLHSLSTRGAAGVSCISDEFWSQLLADIDANVHRSVLQSIQCIWWKGPHSSARTVMWATCNCTKVNEETSGNPIKRLLIVYSRTTAPPSSFLFPPVKIQDCFNSQQHFDMRLLAVDARKPRG